MLRNRGATLIEALLALAIGWILFIVFLGVVSPVQSLAWDLSALHDRDSTVCLAPPLLGKLTSSAGNNRQKDGCLKEGDTLHVRSDTDGPNGFPDGDLDESYEAIAIRRNVSDLQIKSGNGSFQPVFRNFTTFDADGTDPLLLRLKLGAQTDKARIRIPESEPVEVSFLVYLWNRRRNLFEENP